MTDLEYLHMDDLKSDLASAIEQYGARQFLALFKESYPNHYIELKIQINRTANKVPALLRDYNALSG